MAMIPRHGIVTFTTVFLSGLVCMAGLAVLVADEGGQKFDATLWRDASSVANGTRHRMASRLLANDTLIGKTRPEVVERLGEPMFCLREGNLEPDGSDMVYLLGPAGLTDGVWLSVRIGPNGRVQKCFRWTD